MFKFLFGRKDAKVVKETQRQTVERALAELNEILSDLPEKATIAVDMEAGTVSVDLPEQMPDEALALPAPAEKEAAEASDDTPESEAEKDDAEAPDDGEEKPKAA